MNNRSKAFSAVRWTSLSTAIRTALLFFQVIILARILSPSEFGLMAIVTALTSTLTIFADLGFSKGLIYFKNTTKLQFDCLYSFSIVFSIMLMMALCILSPLVAFLYDEPKLAILLATTSLIFPFNALGHQLRVRAEKQLLFTKISAIEISSGLCGFIVAITVANAGGGVWSLVSSLLVSAFTNSVLSWITLSMGWRPTVNFSISEIKKYVHYGFLSVGDSITTSLRMQSDVLIAGLFVGPLILGMYSVAKNLSLRVSHIINPVVTRVSFPVMALASDDRDALKTMYLKTLRLTSSINFPVFFLMFAYTNEVIEVLLGPNWSPSSKFLKLLIIVGLLRSTGNPVGSLIYAVGKANIAFKWNLTLLCIIPVATYIGAKIGGIIGLCYGLVICQLLIVVPLWYFLVRESCGAGFQEYTKQFLVPFLLSLLSTLIAYGFTANIEMSVVKLSFGFFLFGTTYIYLSYYFNRVFITMLLELISPVTKRF